MSGPRTPPACPADPERVRRVLLQRMAAQLGACVESLEHAFNAATMERLNADLHRLADVFRKHRQTSRSRRKW